MQSKKPSEDYVNAVYAHRRLWENIENMGENK